MRDDKMAVAFDTLTASEQLQEAGIGEKESKGTAHVKNGAITGNVATKDDLEKFSSDMKLWMFKALGTVAAVTIVITKILDYVLGKLPI